MDIKRQAYGAHHISATAPARNEAKMTQPLILASASPRRSELLARVGVAFEVVPADVDETVEPGETAPVLAQRLAALKAAAVKGQHPERWVLAADTVVEVDGVILGKADDEAAATAMLELLVDNTHRVVTGFALRGPGEFAVDRVVSTEVVMRGACAGEVRDYVGAGEWRGKAGAYAVQGMAAALVREVRGSITNVVGLPLAEVLTELAVVGAAIPSYQRGVSA
jgi:septum formation protein